ncbi:DUF2726 domain-containing protein [Suttonella ornithocola]|uniref:Protein of uncharacterized function (DUF2726) n=1 Tax=Suttonella ornithocola TaxID=279832 RepID=A0A380RC69_9GAMM|nr:DUF2726 domain-containing protein [Suttonella ornithocola]SUO95430.1 Protein of uncharacterised function (DUF2726) [Suttonella ornithocola]SUQ09734.1 Protein of uncharacterised function (DUF2726) [Suttonella ornithocola]
MPSSFITTNLISWLGVMVLILALLGLFKKRKKKFNDKAFYQAQKQRVQKGGYCRQKLLNETEKAAYQALLNMRQNKALQIFAQVSLGEILSHQDYQRYRDIMSKRVDFLITDKAFLPLFAIEIHGTGHYLSHNAKKRDEIKQLALNSAGIQYIAIEVNRNNVKQKVTKACQVLFKKY